MDVNELSMQFTTYAYPAIAGLYLLYVFTRSLRYWQVNRDPWLLWKVMSGLGSALFFGMYTIGRSFSAPYTGLSCVFILIGMAVSVFGELHDVLVIAHRRRATLCGPKDDLKPPTKRKLKVA